VAVADGEKKFPLMLVVGMIVVGLVLAGGISYFIATKIVANKTTAQTAAKGTVPQHKPGVFVTLGDPQNGLIINVGGVNSGRFLKIGLVVDMKLDKGETAPKGTTQTPSEVKILDTVVQALRSEKISAFDPAKQDQLKAFLKDQINKAFGEEKVYNVYITNFVLQ
jgi:flagellar FliL protein